MSPLACPICALLGSVEKAFSAPGTPLEDRRLPTAASRLAIVPSFDYPNKEKSHVRRCPNCAALYAYRLDTVATTNGEEVEEVLTRLNPAAAESFLRRQARFLEAIRRDIDDAEGASAALSDFLERGHPPPEEARRIIEHMQSLRARVLHGRHRLQAQVEAYRRAGPEILMVWAQAHRRVCQGYLSRFEKTAAAPGFDVSAARYIARTALAAWENLPRSGEAFIPINTSFLADYHKLLRAELER